MNYGFRLIRASETFGIRVPLDPLVESSNVIDVLNLLLTSCSE